MPRILLVVLFMLTFGIARADTVTDWNNVTLDVIKSAKLAPPQSAYLLAVVHTAIFDSVNAIDRSYSVYHVNAKAEPGTSASAAAASAAHQVLIKLHPEMSQMLDAALDSSLSKIPDGKSKTDGVALGRTVADAIVNWRRSDHGNEIKAYTPSGKIGSWEPTPPNFPKAQLPNYAYVTPFAMTDCGQFRPKSPPPFTSSEYTYCYNETRLLGKSDSTVRTPEQTQTALFWADPPGTITTAGRWNLIAQQVAAKRGNTLVQNARLFALLNIAVADAGIAAWDCKYNYNCWRPVTAIPHADKDGNPNTAPESGWMPLIATPPHPEYPSGHSTFSSAAATILALFFGDDQIGFTVESYSPPTVRRVYASFSHAARQGGMSRIYGGIHYNFSNTAGREAGSKIGRYVWQKYLRPVKG